MRLVTIATVSWCVLLFGTVFRAEAGGEKDPQGDTGQSRVFNVLRYGAVGDDKTDNTEAFSACLKALVEAGGGRMVLPNGIYHGTIVIPPVSKSWVSLEIAGECEPNFVFGTIGANSLPAEGTIVKGRPGSGRAVIRAEPAAGTYQDFSSVSVILKNLDVRTSDDPDIDGIDLHYAQQCKLENVFVNTGVYNVQASKPTHGTCGIITPAINNAANTVLRDVAVTGYHSGIQVNEHTDGDTIVVASNINGLEFVKAHHASRFARVGAYRNTHHVTVSGKHGFSISQLNTEQPGAGQTDAGNVWQTLVSDVHDPGNLGVADINYWVVVGNDGARDTFVKTGGTLIRARRIGSDPVNTVGGRK
jgi:hypothetical protein